MRARCSTSAALIITRPSRGVLSIVLFVLLAAPGAGVAECNLTLDQAGGPIRAPVIVFVHGARGSTEESASLTTALESRARLGWFAYDDRERLAKSSKCLRRELTKLDSHRGVIVVAHSMGALLPMYVGATDRVGAFSCLGAIYLNPLIGGSHYADDIRALRWLRPLKPFIQRMFFPPSVRDLAPESDFEQSIFGYDAPRSSFRDNTVMFFTEREGEEPGIVPDRVPLFFGQSRDELLERIGTVVNGPLDGHVAPLQNPALVIPLLEGVVRKRGCAPEERWRRVPRLLEGTLATEADRQSALQTGPRLRTWK